MQTETALLEPTTAKRGRPREFCPDKALTQALKVFWARGYEAASMAELTEAMGITKPSLYACFGNKEALFRKALDLYEREKLAFVRYALQAPTAKGVAESFLRGALAMYTGEAETCGCLQVMSAVASSNYADSLREEVMRLRKASELALIERLEQAAAAGDFPAELSASQMATYLFTLLQGMAVQAQSGASQAVLEDFVNATLMIWPGR